MLFRLTALFAGVLLAAAASAPAHAQSGTVSGIVRDASTDEVLPSASIIAVGTTHGAVSAPSGKYRLYLAPGQYTLRATFVGYAPREADVIVRNDEDILLDFALRATTVPLDEVVVSGSGMGLAAKRLGSSAVKIDAAALMERAPVINLTELLQSRAPGVVTLLSSGEQGAAASLRLRGFKSFTLSQEPVVYVDGIRIDNGGGWGHFFVQTGGQAPSHLGDINPHDIESVEILRGAAAATLYGTEASTGVISISTRQGRQGPPRLRVHVEQGAVSAARPIEANYNYIPTVEKLNARVARHELRLPRTMSDAEAAARWPELAGAWAGDADLTAAQLLYGYEGEDGRIISNHPLETSTEPGRHQAYLGSVVGGNSGVSYYFSGKFDRTAGSLGPPDNNFHRRVTLHGSFSAALKPRLSLEINTNLIDGRLRMMDNSFGNFSYLIAERLANPVMALPPGTEEHEEFVRIRARGPAGEFFTTGSEVEAIETTQDKARFFGSARVTYAAGNRFRNELIAGVDRIEEENIRFFPYGAVQRYAEGNRTDFRRTTINTSFENRATLVLNAGPTLTSTTMAGGQAVVRNLASVLAWGDNFTGPGLETLGSTTVQGADEYREESIHAGAYMQQQMGYRDHFFATIGGRIDGSTSFGDDFRAQFYPSAGISYVVSEAPYWPLRDDSRLNALRVRGAVGRTGLVPGPFASLQTYGKPIFYASGKVLVPQSFGDPHLRPAVTTESELGFDLSLFGERIGLEVTRYFARTEDDLIAVPVAPSLGYMGTQLRNLGEVVSSGFEFGVNAIAVQRRSTSLRLNAFLATNASEIRRLGTTLGDGSAIESYNNHRRGYPPAAFFSSVLDPAKPYVIELNGNGIPNEEADFALLEDIGEIRFNRLKTGGPGSPDSLIYAGDPNPGLTGAVSVDLRIFGNIRVYALLDWMADYQISNGTSSMRYGYFLWSRPWLHLGQRRDQAEIQQELFDPATTVARKKELVEHLTTLTPEAGINTIEDGDFARLREVSIAYFVSQRVARRLGVRDLSIRLSARNLLTFTRYSGTDPEINAHGRDSFNIGADFMTVPQMRRIATAITVEF